MSDNVLTVRLCASHVCLPSRAYLLQTDPNSNPSESQHSESNVDSTCSRNMDRIHSSDPNSDYIKFCQSLAMPIVPENDEDHDADSDSDFRLEDELSIMDHHAEDAERQSIDNKAAVHLPSPSTAIDLSQDQIDRIRKLMPRHFQIVMQLRLLTIDKMEFREQHQICDDLLMDLREMKVG